MAMSVVYTTVNGQILSESRGGTVSHFVPDPLGSVVMVRDTSGNTVYEAEYDPYGNVQSETGTNPSSLGYVGTLGYIKDSATSMYVRARYLLNNLGRWLTKDPLWPREPGFVYAGAAPNCSVDMLGLKPVYAGPLPGIWPPGCGYEDNCENARDLCLQIAQQGKDAAGACLAASIGALAACAVACAGSVIVIGIKLCTICLIAMGISIACITLGLAFALGVGLWCLLAYEACKRGQASPGKPVKGTPGKGKPVKGTPGKGKPVGGGTRPGGQNWGGPTPIREW